MNKMGAVRRALVLSSAGMALVLASGGCSRLRDHKGYTIDQTLVQTVQPGIDNRDSVAKTLGHASFESEFDGGGTWYYISRDTRALAFSTPKPVKQEILTIRFAPDGNVSAVQKTGLETIRNVRLYGKTTPTLGRSTSFFSELFGNIGAVGGTGTAAPTADNPNR